MNNQIVKQEIKFDKIKKKHSPFKVKLLKANNSSVLRHCLTLSSGLDLIIKYFKLSSQSGRDSDLLGVMPFSPPILK